MIVMVIMDEKSAQYKQGIYSVKTYNHSVRSEMQQNFIRIVYFKEEQLCQDSGSKTKFIMNRLGIRVANQRNKHALID